MLSSVVISVILMVKASADPASNQLFCFRNKTKWPIGILTASNGAPVEYRDIDGLNSRLLSNVYFTETITHLVRERIPERIVHAKGAGAFGYFQVTHDVTDICKAAFLNKIGKKTPVAVRFSPSSLDKGQADTNVDSRGFAVKFYTENGNFDLLGFHTPMFMLKDPSVFPTVVRVIKRNPVTNLKSDGMLWDFITLRPESILFFVYLFGDNGIPDGFRHMPGYSIHTYQIYNKHGESYFVRFHLEPDCGIKNIYAEEAIQLAATDPDYAIRDLYNAIAKGKFPSWTVYMQVLTLDDVKNAEFDVFDMTKILPIKKYGLRPVGKLVLNKNPKNFFADMEQAAFCPGNLVPGIIGAPDKLFEARRFAYRDAQLYRLGANFNNIGVNHPVNSVYSYDRDGVPPVLWNGGGAPNYYPNSYNGPEPYVEKNIPTLYEVTHDDSAPYEQAAELYSDMSEDARGRLIANIVFSLGPVDKLVQQRAVTLFYKVHSELGSRVAAGLTLIQSNNTNTEDNVCYYKNH